MANPVDNVKKGSSDVGPIVGLTTAGAAVGSAIFPGVGTAVGGLLGGILGVGATIAKHAVKGGKK
jgi:hypothetical protein